MKSMAQLLLEAKLRSGKTAPTSPEVPVPESPPAHSVYGTPDSWARPAEKEQGKTVESIVVTPTTPAARPRRPLRAESPRPAPTSTITREVIEPEGTGDTSNEKRKFDKTRRYGRTVSLSEEERHIIESYLRDHELEFSAWIRELAFNAMRRRIPKRT